MTSRVQLRSHLGFGLAALVAAAVAGSPPAAAQQNWFPSKYGPQDEIGAGNLITPQRVMEAAKLVTTGKTYRLGIEVNRSTPAFPPRNFSITVIQPGQQGGATFGENKMSYNDDIVMGWMGVGSQLDSLAHLGIDDTFYNGNKGKDFAQATGATKLGIEKVPAIVGRGVLINMAKHRNVPMLNEGEVFSTADIEAAAKAQNVTIREGDIVLFHTGWLDMLSQDPKRFGAGEPGIDAAAAEYLAGKGVVAVGADTWGVEAVPFKNPNRLWEGHQILLAKNGVYILEVMDTRQLAADNVNEFMFVLGAPRYTGGIQAIINPIAIR
jgi:kynurenine formamidase